MNAMKPSIGRIVHFNNVVSSSTDKTPDTVEQHAALVIGVHGDTCVSIVAWNEHGTQTTHRSVLQGNDANQWQWPAKV